MKRILVDTHVLVWWLLDHPRLGKKSKSLLANPANEVYVSAASVWEISIKREKGLLDLPEEVFEAIDESGFVPLPIGLFHGQQAGMLPKIHADPFDRMLVAQAQAEGLELMTVDANIFKYGIRVLDAGR